MSERKRTVVEVGALAPLDAKSARVLGGGVHWEPEKKQSPVFVREVEGVLPFKVIRPWIGSAPDITGQRFGRLVVKGLSTTQNPKKRATWVVRCDCGAWEHRKYRTLTKPAGDMGLMCSHCEYLELLRAGKINRSPLRKANSPQQSTGGAA